MASNKRTPSTKYLSLLPEHGIPANIPAEAITVSDAHSTSQPGEAKTIRSDSTSTTASDISTTSTISPGNDATANLAAGKFLTLGH